jgi:glycerate kinase
MNKKILIAPNSFKEAGDSDKIADWFRKYLGNDSSLSVKTLPISDGGDGFLNVCKRVFNLKLLSYSITTPFDESTFNCEIGYSVNEKKIYIESARVLGLKVIPSEHRNPLKISSKGMGDLFLGIIDDIRQNKLSVEEVIIGIGGTGTNDLGLGVCSRFGLELYDLFGKKDRVVPEYFYRIRDIKWNMPELPFKINAVIDVDNPLLGPKGAARTFGPQKGADKGEIEVMELGFNKIVNLLKNKGLPRSYDKLLGAGGGLAAGLYIFFNASLELAKDFIKEQLNLNQIISDRDIILTGEGSFDDQTLSGKGAGIVLDLATEMKKKVILCCGKVAEGMRDKLGKNVEIIEILSYFNNEAESIKNIEKGIEMACRKINSIL